MIMNKITKLLLLILTIGYTTPTTLADPGDIDERGGHYDQKTGIYHLHQKIIPPQPELEDIDDRASAIFHARHDAKRDAERDSTIWYGAGFIFGILGAGVAYITPPEVPAAKLLGKSAEYIIFYTETYKEAVKAERIHQTSTGCAVAGVAAVFYYLYRTGEL